MNDIMWSPAGTFGRVLECWDREDQDYVAIKVIRNVQKYRDAAMIEIDVLRVLPSTTRLAHGLSYNNIHVAR
jgi:hypothetical protein